MSTKNIVRKQRKIKNQQSTWIYCPSCFDPTEYPGAIARHPDAARWMLNCIYYRHIFLNLDSTEYVNLSFDLLAKVFGTNDLVRPIRKALEDYGLIECDGTYSVGSKSYGYRIGPALSCCRWKRFDGLGKRFAKRYEAFKSFIDEDRGFTLPVHYHLKQWGKRVVLDPGYPIALEDIEDKGKRERAAVQAEAISQGMYYRSVCQYGRYHSNFSGLIKELRPYLRIDDCPLVEVDIVNSQPYFLAILLLELALSETTKCSNSLSPLIFSSLSSSSSSSYSPKKEREKGRRPYDSCLSTFQESSIPDTLSELDIPEDLRRFVGNAISGTFYESLNPRQQADRDKLKRSVFAFLYGDLNVMEHSKIRPDFETTYPTVLKTIMKIKKEKGYAWIGQELQRRESEVMVNSVCSKLMNSEQDNIPIVTIHDSIMTTAEHLPEVTRILRQCLSERNYYLPKLKQK